jgi:hypothetical protein
MATAAAKLNYDYAALHLSRTTGCN